MSTRRATIADVAREAGVSPSTASVVFSGTTRVSDATRQRVVEAAERLGYTGPDPRAASLRRGRSGIVGVVFQGELAVAFLDPVVTRVMDGLTEGVAPLGASLLLIRSTGGPETVSSLLGAPLDAVVLMGTNPELREAIGPLQGRGVPVLVIEGDAGAEVPRIALDNREAQRQAASHLRSLGHERVAIVTLPVDNARIPGWIADDTAIDFQVTRDRLRGARDVYPDAPAYAASASSIDAGLAAGRVILAGRPTAVLAQTDLIAAGIIRAAEEAGLGVPDDLSVTGFDGIRVDGLAPYELTTLAQPARDKGRTAGEAIVTMLDGGEAPSIQLSSTFRLGNTTGPRPGLPTDR